MHPNVHYSTIYNAQYMDSTTDKGMDKDVIHIHDGILLGHKKRMKSFHLQQHGWT